MIEWYDFYIFGSLATVLATQFFPNTNPTAALLSTLATFAAGFIVRPFGALVFGRLGDLIGRKYTFMLTLMLMGGATFMIGLVPSYETIGWWAPAIVLLLRLLHGLALGGEYGGAATYVAEYAPQHRRGFYTSWIQTTASVGLLLSLLVIMGIRSLVGEEAFVVWGWRIPFLISVLLLAISVWIRMNLKESPAFQHIKDEGTLSTSPITESFGRWANLRIALLALFGLHIRPRAFEKPSEKQQQLNDLVTRRRQLIAMRTAELNRRDQATAKLAKKSIAATLTFLEKQIDALDAEIRELATHFADKQHALFLGRGTHWPVAMEGALKLKEISYIHAEAYAAGELKHGPLALVDEDMPVIAVAPNDRLIDKLKSNLEEVRARHVPRGLGRRLVGVLGQVDRGRDLGQLAGGVVDALEFEVFVELRQERVHPRRGQDPLAEQVEGGRDVAHRPVAQGRGRTIAA